jgi:hypothetical protein
MVHSSFFCLKYFADCQLHLIFQSIRHILASINLLPVERKPSEDRIGNDVRDFD